jgi:hypothetical protein
MMERIALIIAPTPADAEKPGGIKWYGALQDIVNRAEDLWLASPTSKDLIGSWLYLVDSTKKDEVG